MNPKRKSESSTDSESVHISRLLRGLLSRRIRDDKREVSDFELSFESKARDIQATFQNILRDQYELVADRVEEFAKNVNDMARLFVDDYLQWVVTVPGYKTQSTAISDYVMALTSVGKFEEAKAVSDAVMSGRRDKAEALLAEYRKKGLI